MKISRYLMLAAAMALLLVMITPVIGQISPEVPAPDLKLRNKQFRPAELADRGAILAQLDAAGATLNGADHSWIVQFSGPIEAAWTANLTAMGIGVSEYLPDFAYRVTMNADQAGCGIQHGRSCMGR